MNLKKFVCFPKTYSMLILFMLMILLNRPTVYADTYAWPIFPPKEPQKKNVPIIMYHLITKNPKYRGEFGISPDEMENDLKYLKENGYETVLMADLIKFVNGRQSLPEKPIVLTFDDGRYSDSEYLLPLLKKYEMKAVLSIVGQFTDENTERDYDGRKPHLTWDQLKELQKSKVVEIQSHSYHLHDGIGCGKRKGESMEAYQARLHKDLFKLQETVTKNIGRTPTTFTYPLGIISKGSEEVLKELGFQASLSCYEGMNVIQQGNPDCLFQLRRNIRRSGHPVSSILKKLEKQNANTEKAG